MKSFRFGGDELRASVKVLLWTVASAVVTFLLTLIDVVDIPVQYLPYVPVVNTVLYALKEFFANNE